MDCEHLILLAEDARDSWRVVRLPKVGYILTTEEEKQLLIFEGQRKSFDFNIWHLEHVLNYVGFKDCGLLNQEVNLK